MKGVVSNLKTDWTGGIRGEVLMFHEIWRTKYADKANCRNAASGLMRKKDGQGCEDLTFIAYDASASGDDGCFKTEMDKIEWLRDTGFSASETVILNYVEDVIRYRNEVAEKRAGLPFDIDGLVIKDNKTDAADLRRVRPERQIAFKFDLERATSTLRRVEWSESGGTYTPIGIIDPVRLGGTTVKRANLCNPAMIQDMGLYIGSTVVVVKRGEIIPKIESAEPPFGCGSLRQIVIPTECGCGAKLVNEGTRLYCPNPACDKKLLHRIKKWADVLDIREAGEKTLLQLFNGGRIRRISDLYTLEIRELAAFDRMGEISAAKLVNNIRSPRNIPLSDFIAGFDIEGVGAQIMEVITGAGYDSLEKLRSATVEKLAAIPRIGEITARALIGGLNGTADEMEAVLKTGFVTIADSGRLPLAGQSFCFTGELKTMKRNEAGAKVKSLGGLVKSSVGQGLTYLVTNEPGSGSAKNKSARKSGVKVINEDEFLNVIRKSGGVIPFCA
jgi:DNA ligase (NAD+)